MKHVMVFVGAALTAPLIVAHLEASSSRTVGGNGGTPFVMACGSTKVMAGIRGKHGDYLNRLELLCVGVQESGAWSGSPTYDGGGAGGSGGQTFEIKCPTNQAVSGIAGRAGSWIDALQIQCSPLGPQGRLNPPGQATTQSYAAGGTGGTPFGGRPYRCDDDREPGFAFRGRSGSYIDQLTLICGQPAPWDTRPRL